MRTHLGLGLAAVACVGLLGCGGSSSKTHAARLSTAGVTSGTTGGTTSGSVGGVTTSQDAPRITGVSPGNGPVDGGTAVTITGSNFLKQGAGTTLVLFGTRGVVVTPATDTSITVTAPAQAQAGPVEVRVINDLGQAVQASAFTFDPRATGVAFRPAVGTANPAGQGGTKITLDLQSFVPLTASATVDFGAARATSVKLVDADTLVAEVPAAATAGATTITVTQGGASISAPGFVVQGTLAYGDLVINEALLDPGGADTNNDGVAVSTADEFVELVNTSAGPIDLTYLLLKKVAAGATTSPVVVHTFPNPTTLPAGASIVVFSAGMPNEYAGRHATAHAQTSTYGSLQLTNAGVNLTIEDQHGLLAATVVFQANFPTQQGAGASWVLRSEGQRLTTNPATVASGAYEAHPDNASRVSSANVPFKHSPGTKRDGSAF